MKPRPFRSLRRTLQGALDSRQMTLMNGRCKRKDLDRVRSAIGRAQSFLSSYPVADDARVRQWCHDHMDDVRLIVPGNSPRMLARLIMDELKGEAATSAA